jgi:nitroreductase
MGTVGGMEFEETVRHRRMIRRFDQRPVPSEIVDRILDLARRSPTAGFSQGVDFLVLDAAESIDAFWRLTANPEFPPDADEIEHGPAVIVLPIADHRPYLARYSESDKADFGLQDASAWPVKFWDVDASMAAMTALLAAVDADLGGWFFGMSHGEADLLAHLGVPDGIRPIGVIGLGYRAADETRIGSATTRRRRPFDEQIHRNRW